MTLHKEGYASIAIATLVFGLINAVSFWFLSPSLPWLAAIIFIASFACWCIIVWFFRVPMRAHTLSDGKIIAPADGKVVVMEEITDVEYFKDRRLQISIFMSPLNVHLQRNAVSGQVVYSQYHKGKYLVAWNPKSSTENERHSVVYRLPNGKEILIKQIAGALAKRIVNFLKVGTTVKQGDEMGFIKFGSRVDILLPIGTTINVKLNEIVTGGVTVIAEW
jgi:phosphatidylserine decarboxylase